MFAMYAANETAFVYDGLQNLSYAVANESGNDSADDYDYEYDYDDSLSSVLLWELIPVCIAYGLTFLLGVTGNVLVVVSIVRSRAMQTVTNVFLVSLASADLMLVILCVPIKLAKWFTFSWAFGEGMCKFVHYMQNVSVICSIFTLTGISLERHYAILHPMRAKFSCTIDRTKKVILLIWSMSFVFALPIIFGQVHKEVGVRRKAYWCVKDWSSPLYSKLYEVGMLLLIFVLPLSCITLAYSNICRTLWQVTSNNERMRSERCVQRGTQNTRQVLIRRCRKQPGDDIKIRKQVIKMLATIVVLFVICWGPSLIDNVLVAFSVVERYHYDHLKYMRQAFSLMAYFNSCVNPIVYAFMSKSFRQGFRRTACGCADKPGYRTPTMSARTPQTQWTTAVPHRPAAVQHSASFPQALDLVPHIRQPSA